MEVMPTYFEPRKRGRRPLYDISAILTDLDQHKASGNWLRYELEENKARSAKRQLEKLGVTAAVEAEASGFQLYVKTQ